VSASIESTFSYEILFMSTFRLTHKFLRIPAAGLLVALIAVLPTLQATTVTPASIEVGDGHAVSQILIEEIGAWSVTNDVAWLSVSASDGTGNENLQITVEPNTTGADRTDSIEIGGANFTVTQRAAGSGLQQLWAMGLEAEGRLGDNRILHRTMSAIVMGDVQAVAAAGDHSLILKTDGTLWAAGINSFGQLGDGTLIDRSDPVQVAAAVVTMAELGPGWASWPWPPGPYRRPSGAR
jgi:hypothetical protein